MKAAHVVPTSLLFGLALAVSSSVLAAQSAVRGPTASVLTSTAPGPLRAAVLSEKPDSVERDIRPTYWKEGALVGGLIGLAGGALLGLVVCAQSDQAGNSCSDSAALGALGGVLVLAIPGALIGGQIHKDGAGD